MSINSPIIHPQLHSATIERDASKTERGDIIAIVNQKGGVGKTTTSINLATAMAAANKEVLLIDFDPQGNGSTGLGFDYNQRFNNIYQALIKRVTIESVIYNTIVPHLSLIPATVDLSAAEVEMSHIYKWQYILAKLVETIRNKYDYIFIDCPPSLGLLTVNALTACDSLIIPLQCEFFALEGLSHLLKTVDLIKQNLNPRLKIRGILLTMYDKRNKLCAQVENDVRSYLNELVYKTVIPRNIRISEAPSYGKPAIIYDMKCPGSQAYIYLAKEILELELSSVFV